MEEIKKNKYDFAHIDTKLLDEWMEKHKDILDRCLFGKSWKWVGKEYHSMVSIHLMEEPISNKYDIKQNVDFFYNYGIEKEIGYDMSELFYELSDSLKKLGIDSCGSMGIKEGFIVYGKYDNINNIRKIAEIFYEDFKLFSKIKKEGKGDYSIYLHSDKEKLDAITFNNIEETKPKKENVKKDLDLLKKKKALEKQLKEINEQLNK